MDDGKGTVVSHRRLAVGWSAGGAEGWAERDLIGVELRAMSLYMGIAPERFDILLGPILDLDCSRQQVQPLLEQAWSRLQVLRERLVDLRTGFAEAHIVRLVAQAEAALSTSSKTAVVDAAECLKSAFEACIVAPAVNKEAAQLRALQAMALAVSFNFQHAATLSEEAAALVDSDREALWAYRVQQAEYLLDQGREYSDVDALQALQKLCESVLLPMASAYRSDAEHAWVYELLGQTLGILGRQDSGTAKLDEALALFTKALQLRDRKGAPYEWAATQNHLGNAIGSLGQRQQDIELLERAAATFESALEMPASNAEPEARASLLSNLAAVLQTLGRLKQDAELLSRAVQAYKSALSTWSPERKPLYWAATKANLGSALRLLGEQSEDSALFDQSIDAYRDALSARTRDRMPREWSRTQNDLGAALQAAAQSKQDALLFGRAIAAYREALKEISREGEPMTWAQTTANLGVARRKYAEYNLDVDSSRRAVADIRMAIDVFRGASHPRLSELALEQLAIAMEVNAELETASQDC